MSLRIRLGALAAALLVAGAATAIVLSQSGAHAASTSASAIPAGYRTAMVERRTLVESSKVDGTLGYSGTAELYDRLAGTFTWLPGVGAVIGRGGTLFKVDNLPVVLMYGAVPAYRTLKEGISDGPDVEELNANLVALGYDPGSAITIDGHFGEATAAAVRRWQKAEGLTESGEVELGRVIFAPGARRVTALHVGIGEDPPPSEASPQSPSSDESPKSKGDTGSNGSSTPPGNSKPPSKPSGSPSGNKGSPSGKKGSPSGKKGSPSGNKGSPSGNKGSPSGKKGSPSGNKGSPSGKKGSSPEKHGSPSGESSGSAAPVLVMTTTAGRQVVQLQVKADQQELAHVGEHVPVTLPDGTVVHGRITEVGTVATESSSGEGEKNGSSGSPGGGNNGSNSGSGENATISVTVALDHPVAHLDKAPVSVELVKSIRRNVLTVPATALVATGGGGYAVQTVAGDRRVELAVTPGMFANGYVEVEGPAIHEGLTVLVPE